MLVVLRRSLVTLKVLKIWVCSLSVLLTSPSFGVNGLNLLPLKHLAAVLVVMTSELHLATARSMFIDDAIAWVDRLTAAILLRSILMPLRCPRTLCAVGVTLFRERTLAVIRHSRGRNARRDI